MPKNFLYKIRRFRALNWTILILVLVTAALFLHARLTSADTTTFYPTSCLGGWTNPFKAADKPEVSDDNSNILSRENSAVLPTNTHADIFCGGFKGNIPEDSQAKKIILTMSWDVAKDDADAPKIISGENFDSNAGNILDASSSEGVSFTLTASSTATSAMPTLDVPTEASDKPSSSADTPPTKTPTPVAPASAPDKTPDKTPDQTTDQTTFLNLFATPAFAEEVAADSTPSASDTPAVTDNAAPAASDIASDTRDVASTSNSASDAPGTTTESASQVPTEPLPSTPDSPSSASSGNEFLEVFYTLDGTHWESLGRVDAEHLRYSIFEIPVPPDTKWSDMSGIQIAVKSLASIDNSPAVYLDGMTLQVTYGKADTSPFVSASGLYISSAHSYSPNFNFKLRNNQRTQEVVVTSGTPLGGIAIFDKNTGTLIEDSYVEGNEFVIQPESFGKGDYVFVRTNDPNNCADTAFELCRAGALGEEGRFIVGNGESAAATTTTTDSAATTSAEASS